jgi:hypothetical protein
VLCHGEDCTTELGKPPKPLARGKKHPQKNQPQPAPVP